MLKPGVGRVMLCINNLSPSTVMVNVGAKNVDSRTMKLYLHIGRNELANARENTQCLAQRFFSVACEVLLVVDAPDEHLAAFPMRKMSPIPT